MIIATKRLTGIWAPISFPKAAFPPAPASWVEAACLEAGAKAAAPARREARITVFMVRVLTDKFLKLKKCEPIEGYGISVGTGVKW